MLRNITRITAPSTRPARRTDVAATIAGAVVTPVVPVAVASLVATAGTARITLTWPAVTGAVSYDVESSAASAGTFTVLSHAGGTGYADLSASTAAITYYRVRARNAVGAGPYSPVASATATAASIASAGATTLIPVPTNLRSMPTWVTASNVGSDVLQWDGVAAATSYKVYLGDLLVGTVAGAAGNPPATTYQNITPRQEGLLYTVTAVTAQGESVPSGVTLCYPSFPPGSPPFWANTTSVPTVNLFLLAEAEWNAGRPRILVRWGGGGTSPFNVYRDGIVVARGLSSCLYVDSAITAGQSYSYTTSSSNPWAPSPLEGPQSTASTATAPTGPPALSSTPIPITRTVSRDDSVYVFFNLVAGAKDYICYKDNSAVAPEVLLKNGKAAGEYRYVPAYPQDTPAAPNEVCIQMNDLDPVNPTTLRLAAVDKLARFQKQDGMMTTGMGAVPGGPSMPNMNSDGVAVMNGPTAVDGFVKNGQGDPSNVPNIVALSAPFAVSCTPFVFLGTDGHGGQPFLDRFRTGINEPIVAAPLEADLALHAQTQTPSLLVGNADLQRYLTPNWSFTNYGLDNANTKIFFMPHLMTTVYDGGGPGAPFAFGRPNGGGMHIANSSLTLQPRENDPASPNFGANKYFSIAGGKTLHVTMEVDTHVNGRRFVLMMLKGRGQTLYTAAPTKMHPEALVPTNRATTDANLFAVVIGADTISVVVFQANGSTTSRPYDQVDVSQLAGYLDGLSLSRRIYPRPGLNGTTRDLDKTHRFHLYISHTQFRIVEEGPDSTDSIAFDRPFPAGYVLPWDEVEPVFVHEVYHTGIDSLDGEEYVYGGSSPGGPNNRHWIVNSPYRDERHWDNMGARVLDAFPIEPLGMQVDRASIPAGTTVTINVTLPLGNIAAGGFSLSATTAGSAITNTTFVDDTHATVTIHAGVAGSMPLRYNNPTRERTVLLTVV